jgi:hypothetical protein
MKTLMRLLVDIVFNMILFSIVISLAWFCTYVFQEIFKR